jgi:bifunctional UDP-N-acetylglucosamine pyrophosphorylase/glucosamine-1-phosphate N-acetyltransferase
METVVFVLAAGKSSRMNSSISKVLSPLGGRRVLDYVLDIAKHWGGDAPYVVASPYLATSLEQETIHVVVQEEPRGTGHAFSLAFNAALDRDPHLLKKEILVLLGDVPLLQTKDIEPLMAPFSADVAVIAMTPPDPLAYGRLIVEQGKLKAIVESRDATSEQLSISLCNTGVMRINASFAHRVLPTLTPSPTTGEYYYTDFIHKADHAIAVEGQWDHFLGINTRQELAQAEESLQNRFRERAFEQGAFLMDPHSTFFSFDTRVHRDVVIHPFTCFGPQVALEEGVVIHSFCSLSGCHIKKGSSVGPFAHMRLGTTVGPYATIGNFVETKNAQIGYASQAKHLSYLGDVIIGDHVNIGAGTLTLNYDGHTKHKTTIEEGVSIGGNTSLVAPLTIGANATVGAGSVITKNVPEHTLSLSRSEQKTIPLPASSKHLNRPKKKHPPQK